MSSPLEEAKKFLPRYLNDTSRKELLDCLENEFPKHANKRFYTSIFASQMVLCQGDGLYDLLISHLPSPTIKPAPCLIFTNTCDIDPSNTRLLPIRLCYAPIFRLSKYVDMLDDIWVKKKKKTQEAIDAHVEDIQKQIISNILYLPKGGKLEEESLVFLDRTNNCPIKAINCENLPSKKIFSLSNVGFWILLFKLSVHFSRIKEGLDRRSDYPGGYVRGLSPDAENNIKKSVKDFEDTQKEQHSAHEVKDGFDSSSGCSGTGSYDSPVL